MIYVGPACSTRSLGRYTLRVEPKIQYATSTDGTRLAFSVQGEGEPMVIAPMFVASFALEHMVPGLKSFHERIGRGRQVVRYDMRGTGLSRELRGPLTLDQLVVDLEIVVDAAKLRDFDLFATGMAGPMALVFAHRHQNRPRRMVLYATLRKASEMAKPEAFSAFDKLTRENWELTSWTIGGMGGPRDEHPRHQPDGRDDGVEGLGSLFHRSSSGEVAADFIAAATSRDLSPLLPEIRVETLVVHKRGDPIVPFEAGRRLAADLPNARFLPLIGNVNVPAGEGDEMVVDPTVEFLNAGRSGKAETQPDDAASLSALTAREREVLALLAGGSSNREISAALTLSERTVVRHLANIYGKIGAHSRVDAASFAFRHGIR